jgi:hypothetical protein
VADGGQAPERAVTRRPEDPAPSLGGLLAGGPGVPGGEERVLGDVGGRIGVVEDLPGDVDARVEPPLEQRPERRHVGGHRGGRVGCTRASGFRHAEHVSTPAARRGVTW